MTGCYATGGGPSARRHGGVGGFCTVDVSLSVLRINGVDAPIGHFCAGARTWHPFSAGLQKPAL